MSKNDGTVPPTSATCAPPTAKTRPLPKNGWRDPERRRAFALGSLRDAAGARPVIKPVSDS